MGYIASSSWSVTSLPRLNSFEKYTLLHNPGVNAFIPEISANEKRAQIQLLLIHLRVLLWGAVLMDDCLRDGKDTYSSPTLSQIPTLSQTNPSSRRGLNCSGLSRDVFTELHSGRLPLACTGGHYKEQAYKVASVWILLKIFPLYPTKRLWWKPGELSLDSSF